jgi:hypothetical protein
MNEGNDVTNKTGHIQVNPLVHCKAVTPESFRIPYVTCPSLPTVDSQPGGNIVPFSATAGAICCLFCVDWGWLACGADTGAGTSTSR